jgi:hypothetical protein
MNGPGGQIHRFLLELAATVQHGDQVAFQDVEGNGHRQEDEHHQPAGVVERVGSPFDLLTG